MRLEIEIDNVDSIVASVLMEDYRLLDEDPDLQAAMEEVIMYYTTREDFNSFMGIV